MTDEFNRIFEMYSKDLFHLIFSYTLNISDTKDILQDTFMKYYKKMSTVSKKDLEIKKWLMRVAINQVKDYKKCYWKRNIVTINDNNSTFKNFETNSDILEILKKLERKYRIPIYLYYYEGYSISEISNILKLSESAVKMRLSRAKERLKKEMEAL